MKNKNLFFIHSLILSFLIFLPLACKRRVPKVEDTASLEVLPPSEEKILEEEYRFSDIPVPYGFRLSRKDSFVYETSSIKAGKLIYKGTETIRDLVEFYKMEMPNHGWNLVNVFEDERVLINFVKEGWASNIKISKGAWTSVVEIKIGPTD